MDALEQVAISNGGLVTIQQAAEVGVDRRRLADLARLGQLARLARGVYAVGTKLADPRPIVTSARGTLSHHSAAAWWGVELPKAPSVVHLTVPRNRGQRHDAVRGVRLHRRDLPHYDVTAIRGTPISTPLRTAIDIARCDSLENGVAIVDAFLRARLITAYEFEQAAAASAGPGRARLIRVAELIDDKSGSVLESLTRVLLWRNGLMPPTTQHWITVENWTGRVDFAWPGKRAVLETDGFAFHASRENFEADRRRWSALSRGGWSLGVVTWRDVTAEPAYVVGLVRDLLDIQHTTVTEVA